MKSNLRELESHLGNDGVYKDTEKYRILLFPKCIQITWERVLGIVNMHSSVFVKYISHYTSSYKIKQNINWKKYLLK